MRPTYLWYVIFWMEDLWEICESVTSPTIVPSFAHRPCDHVRSARFRLSRDGRARHRNLPGADWLVFVRHVSDAWDISSCGNTALKICKSACEGCVGASPSTSRIEPPLQTSFATFHSGLLDTPSSDARFAFAFCLEGSAYLRGPGGTSPRLFLIVHRTWTWLDHGPRVVGATSSPALFPSACADRCRWIREARREREKGREGDKQRKREDKVTRRRRWMEKKHNDGPGIEPVSNLH